MEYKYKTLKELKDALDSRALILGETDTLTLDNDSAYLYVSISGDDDEDKDQVFEIHPNDLHKP